MSGLHNQTSRAAWDRDESAQVGGSPVSADSRFGSHGVNWMLGAQPHMVWKQCRPPDVRTKFDDAWRHLVEAARFV